MFCVEILKMNKTYTSSHEWNHLKEIKYETLNYPKKGALGKTFESYNIVNQRISQKKTFNKN